MEATAWVAFGLAVFAIIATPMLMIGIADAQGDTGWRELPVLLFTAPGALLGGVVLLWARDDTRARPPAWIAFALSLGCSAWLAMLLLW